MYCEKCKQKFDSEKKYCPNCGESLVNITQKNGKNKSNMRNKGLITVIIAAVLVLVVTAGVVFGKGLFGSKNPEKKVVDGYMNSFVEAEQAEYITTLSFDEFDFSSLISEEEGAILNILKDLKLVGITKMDRIKDQYELDLSLNLSNSDLFTMTIYFDTEGLAITAEDFYDKQLYFTWQELSGLIKEETGMELSITEYINYLADVDESDAYKALDYDKYKDVVEDFIKDKVEVKNNMTVEVYGEEIKGEQILLDITPETSNQLLVELVKVGLQDELIFDFTKQIVHDFIDIIIETEDFKSLGINPVELEVVKTLIEENIAESPQLVNDDMLNDLLEEMYELLYDLLCGESEITEVPNIENNYNFYFKRNDLKVFETITSISTLIPKVDETISMNISSKTLIKSINKKIEFTKIDKNNGVNIIELNENDIEDIIEKIKMQSPLFMINKDLSELFNQFIY
ncbi:MAG: hypothetical protein ACLFMO_05185 [Eubacteriales bacterium]